MTSLDRISQLKNRKSFENMDQGDDDGNGRESIEAAPLLEHEQLSPSGPSDHERPRISEEHKSNNIQIQIQTEIDKRRDRQRLKITVLVIAVTILVNLPGLLQDAPQLRILEDILCKKYYQRIDATKIIDGKIDEALCKIELVQGEVATLRGWVTFTATLPGLFLAIPLGWWADKYGRKWLASVFFIYAGASRVSSLIAPSMAAYLMRNNPWIPLTLGLVLQSLSIPVSLMIPETLGFKKPGESSDAVISHRGDNSTREPTSPLVGRKLVRSATNSIAFLGRDWRVLFLCSLYPFRVMESSLEGTVLQLITTRYTSWTIANATYMYSVQAAVSLVVLLGILPLASSFLMKRPGWSFRRKDILLARVGLTFFSAGVVLIGLAPTMVILICGMVVNTLGAGAGAANRALVTGYVQPNEVGRLYTFITIIETAGLMLGGPIVAWLFNAGLDRVRAGGSKLWLGLPWDAIGGIELLSVIALWLLRLEKKEQRSQGSEEFVVGDVDGEDDIELEPLKKE
ncbi:MAG: hypothetical protein MMC33_002649 [Icmadophila ericetorum]|nr:hypothetical protein [Icmadophila ericetorum]